MAAATPPADAETTEETAGTQTAPGAESFENGEVLDVPNVNSHVVGVDYVAPAEPKTDD